MNRDDLLFLIERYGYARRNGEHQGKKSAEWMAEIDRAIAACVAEALAKEPTRYYPTASVQQAFDSGYAKGREAALADPLAMLEALAKMGISATFWLTDNVSFGVVNHETHTHYWCSRQEVSREDIVSALPAGKGDSNG